MLRMMKRAAMGLALGVIVGGLAAKAVRAETTIKIDGSSTVYPITEAVAEEYQKAKKGAVKVTVGISGTGGGFKKFVRGEIEISDASRPILAKEMEEAKKNGIEYIELPIAFDALTVMINPKNDWVDQLTVAELKTIWAPEAQGKVTSWKQVRETFPDKPLKLYGAGSDSGTFDYFTEAIVGKAKSSRGDYTASEDDNVLVQGISNDTNALGYFGYAYYAENKDKLKAVPVVDPKTRKAVTPSEETVLNSSYQPLSRPIFIYVNKKALEKSEVRDFVEFYLKNGAEMSKEVKYVPLPADAYTKGAERLASMKTGTAFGGQAEVGVHIDELFKRDLVSEPKVAAGK
jgi:phosphate transport system substrate-binding protein